MGIETLTWSQGMQLAGAGASAVGAYKNSAGSKAAYGAQAQVNANNATISDWQAQDALLRGDREAGRQHIKVNQTKGTQRAHLAAAGVDIGEGSALNILTDTEYFGQVDIDTIKDNAGKEAWALRNQAANYRSESSLLQNRADRESPLMAAGTSLLTSAGKVAGNWYGPAKKSEKT